MPFHCDVFQSLISKTNMFALSLELSIITCKQVAQAGIGRYLCFGNRATSRPGSGS